MPTIQDLQKEVIKPGIYFNMPDEVYHADKSISNSGMGKLQHTPKWGLTVPTPRNYWYESNFNPNKEPLDTTALKMGRALHYMVLEPEKFHQEFKIKPKVKTTKVAGMIGEGQYEELKNAADALRNSGLIYSLFMNVMPEVAIFWVDEETGVPCRAKIDALGLNIAADLKGTHNAYDVGYSIVDCGYHRQAGYYLEGISQIKELIKNGTAVIEDCPDQDWLEKFCETTHDKFPFIFQEKKAPYITRAIQLCPAAELNGLERARAAMQIFKQNYEQYGEEMWGTGLVDGVEMITIDELPKKIEH
jgi:hypothetical protein